MGRLRRLRLDLEDKQAVARGHVCLCQPGDRVVPGKPVAGRSLGARELTSAAIILAGVIIITMPDNVLKANGRLRRLLYLR